MKAHLIAACLNPEASGADDKYRAYYLADGEDTGRCGHGATPEAAAAELEDLHPSEGREPDADVDPEALLLGMVPKLIAGVARGEVIRAIRRELLRQHEESGPEGLKVSFTEDDGIRVDGRVDASALALAAFSASLATVTSIQALTDSLLEPLTPGCPSAERLGEAEQLLKRLMDHEGAEGWSDGLKADLTAFFKAHDPEPAADAAAG